MVEKIMRFLCTASGVRKDALARAPNAMAQPAIFGLAILCTSSVAFLAAAYAIYRVFYGDNLAWLASIVSGLLWGGLVFSIDRSMLNIDKSGPPWKVAALVGLRLAMAVAVGISISQPVFLRIARSPIDLGIHLAAREQFANEAAENAAQEGLPEKVQSYSAAEEEAKSAQSDLDSGPGQSHDYSEKVNIRDAAEARYHNLLERIGPTLQLRQRQLAALPNKEQATSPLFEEVQRMRIEIRNASQALARANADVERAEAAWRLQATDRLTGARQELEETRRTAVDTNKKVEHENSTSRSEIMAFNQPDLATEFTRAEQIMHDAKNPYSRSLTRLSWMLHSLFVLLEALIVSMKMLTPESGMDKAVKAVETEEQERLFLEANARIKRLQLAEEATTEVYEKAVAKWRKEQLAILDQPNPTTTPALLALRKECVELEEAAA
jgi:hypothetical protein